MALLGNASLLHRSPAKYLTGTVGFCDRANWNKPGQMRNRGDLTLSTLWKYDAVPSGTYAGRAFLAPQTAGRLVTRSPIAVNAAASGASGIPGAASATISVNAVAIGGLFAGGVASATITINGTAAISGLAAGSAAGTVNLAGTAVPGATAWGIANATVTVTGTATAYGIGYMQASTVDNSVLTPASITAAVWSALSADYNTAGTMGSKLNSAASGGVDYAALGAAVWEALTSAHNTAGTFGAEVQAGGGGGATAGEVADAVRVELATELAQLTKVSTIHGVGVPLVVTATSRVAGDLNQTISTTGGTTTVSAA